MADVQGNYFQDCSDIFEIRVTAVKPHNRVDVPRAGPSCSAVDATMCTEGGDHHSVVPFCHTGLVREVAF